MQVFVNVLSRIFGCHEHELSRYTPDDGAVVLKHSPGGDKSTAEAAPGESNRSEWNVLIKDVREPASSYYAGSHRTGHRLAMGSKMAVCLRLFDNGANSIPSNIASRRLH